MGVNSYVQPTENIGRVDHTQVVLAGAARHPCRDVHSVPEFLPFEDPPQDRLLDLALQATMGTQTVGILLVELLAVDLVWDKTVDVTFDVENINVEPAIVFGRVAVNTDHPEEI